MKKGVKELHTLVLGATQNQLKVLKDKGAGFKTTYQKQLMKDLAQNIKHLKSVSL